MSDARELPLDPGARRFRRPLVVGLLVSAALHLGLALVWRTGADGTVSPSRQVHEQGPEPGWTREALHAVNIAEPAPRDLRIPAPPAPVVADRVRVATPEVSGGVGLQDVRLAPVTGGSPSGSGAPGAGTDGTSRDSVRPPMPRSVLPEWDPPESVRGSRIRVRVFVDAHGSPAGPVELDPPTSSRDFNRKLIRKVRRMEFRPARGPEGPVAAWAELTFVF